MHYIILRASKEETLKRAVERSKLDRKTNIDLVETCLLYKSYFAMRLAAACTNRKPLPGMETLEPFNIIYQTADVYKRQGITFTRFASA